MLNAHVAHLSKDSAGMNRIFDFVLKRFYCLSRFAKNIHCLFHYVCFLLVDLQRVFQL